MGRSVKSPIVGALRRVEDVACRPFTFSWDRAGHAGRRAAVHVTSWTGPDAHRAEPIPLRNDGAGLDTLRLILPEDGIWSYRYVVEAGAGGDHARDSDAAVVTMQSDPLNDVSIDHPRLGPSSVLIGPAALTHPAWSCHSPVAVRREAHVLRLPDREVALLADPRDQPGPAGQAPVCVVFDETAWMRLGLAVAADRYAPVVHFALVDTLDVDRRARDLTNLARAQIMLAGVIDIVGARLGRALTPQDIIVVGQSYGGLAAAQLAACRPDLAGAAIAQSASFWFRGSHSPADPRTEPGDLVGYLRSRAGSFGMTGLCGRARPGRIVVQVGTDERDQVEHARWFRDAAREAGLSVIYREQRGGHDYAWWSHGLLTGLDLLLSATENR